MQQTPQEIDVAELAQMRRDGTPHAVLDIREAWEVEVWEAVVEWDPGWRWVRRSIS